MQGRDLGTELSATGTISGVLTSFNTLATAGSDGINLHNGFLSLRDAERGWGAEGGDLNSEIWGSRKGFRFLLNPNSSSPRALSLYLGGGQPGWKQATLAYRDQWELGPTSLIGGEIASNGTYLIRGMYRYRFMNAYAYYRNLEGTEADGPGGSLFLRLWRGISVQAGMSRSGSRQGEVSTITGSVRIPIRQGADLSFGRTQTEADLTRIQDSSIMLTYPVGPLRAILRYQEVHSAADWGSFARRELLFSASYSANSRLRMNFQTVSQWQPNDQSRQLGQVAAAFSLTRKTVFEAVGDLSLTPLEDLRIRLRHQLSEDFVIIAEYGRVSPFQGAGSMEGPMYKVTVQKSWNLAMPAHGAEIYGQVRDQLGNPVSGAVVCLGTFRMSSDSGGHYRFDNVPPGIYELELDKATIPAYYGAEQPARKLPVSRSTRQNIDFEVIPLGFLRGFVYYDRNQNGTRDADEGIGGIVLQANDKTVLSSTDGSFEFYNLNPGNYKVTISSTKLPSAYEPGSLIEADVLLTSNQGFSSG